jgi:hypothetical protein
VRNPFPVVAALLFLTLTTGCTTAARLARPLSQATTAVFTSATLSDLKLTGIKTGPAIPVQAEPPTPADIAALDDATQQAITQIRRQGPVGILLPGTKVGETTPSWICCPAGELQARCEAIPPNATVTFSGQPLGHGMVLLPNRLTWTAQ